MLFDLGGAAKERGKDDGELLQHGDAVVSGHREDKTEQHGEKKRKQRHGNRILESQKYDGEHLQEVVELKNHGLSPSPGRLRFKERQAAR